MKKRGPSAQLREYQRKRDFSRTAEPSVSDAPNSGERDDNDEQMAFVVQKHQARRLHFDLRLELNGVMLSWAVTRGPSLDPKDKRLAVRTEDHPLAYADFEGQIPAGQYGAGTVMIWDTGYWTASTENMRDFPASGRLRFQLHGRRLRGDWLLVRMRAKSNEKAENWLLRPIIPQHQQICAGKYWRQLIAPGISATAIGLTGRRSAGGTGMDARNQV